MKKNKIDWINIIAFVIIIFGVSVVFSAAGFFQQEISGEINIEGVGSANIQGSGQDALNVARIISGSVISGIGLALFAIHNKNLKK
ncbi:MAG: hypothetical protein KAU20_00955 [Nanoarchaeota archaeon]|nr:hypothetical protein [Nanoarchaeota archaeon]